MPPASPSDSPSTWTDVWVQTHLPRRQLAWLVLIVLVIASISCTPCIFLLPCSAEGQLPQEITRFVCGVVLLLPPAVRISFSARDRYLKVLAAYMFFNYATNVWWVYRDLVECYEESMGTYKHANWMWHIGRRADFVLMTASLCFVQRRVDSMATSTLHRRTLWVTRVIVALIALPCVLMMNDAITLATLSLVCVYLGIVLVFFWRIYRVAKQTAALAAGRQAAKAQFAADTLRKDVRGMVCGIVSSLIYNFGFLATYRLDPVPFMYWYLLVVKLFDHIANQAMAVVLSGLLNGALTAKAKKRESERLRRRRWEAAVSLYKPEDDSAWMEKVKELAGRGLTLDSLLGFYEKLGHEYMEHFDPRYNTTLDVVRGAIIPLSTGKQCAMAEEMMGGAYTRPQAMCTHNWSNRFVDLVAAVVADAMDEDEFAVMSGLLMQDVALLRQWAETRGALGKTYWICAFSVNQHRGICGGNPDFGRDKVTGQPHATCQCTMPKAFNTTPPLLPDGRSIECEMNKFDCMMEYLATTDPQFEQVVAIDRAFNLFSRAWCIAEIATANTVGIVQRLKVSSADRFKAEAARLDALRIENMESSRPEDKEEILARIPDMDAFNRNLHNLLFSDLIPDWGGMHRMELTDMIGRFIRAAELLRMDGIEHVFTRGDSTLAGLTKSLPLNDMGATFSSGSSTLYAMGSGSLSAIFRLLSRSSTGSSGPLSAMVSVGAAETQGSNPAPIDVGEQPTPSATLSEGPTGSQEGNTNPGAVGSSATPPALSSRGSTESQDCHPTPSAAAGIATPPAMLPASTTLQRPAFSAPPKNLGDCEAADP